MSESYESLWGQIKNIANNVNSERERAETMRSQMYNYQSQLDMLGTDYDEDGYDRNEYYRENLENVIHEASVQISSAERRQSELEDEAYRIAAECSSRAGEIQKKAGNTAQTKSTFDQLTGFRFGASTAREAAQMTGERSAYYEEQARILNELSDAAKQAADGHIASVYLSGTKTKGQFRGSAPAYTGSRARHMGGTYTGTSVKDGTVRTRSSMTERGMLNQMGLNEMPVHQNGQPDFRNFAVGCVKTDAEGENMIRECDAKNARSMRTTPEQIAKYRKENNLEWRRDMVDQKVYLVPSQISKNYPQGRVIEPSPAYRTEDVKQALRNRGYEVVDKDGITWAKNQRGVYYSVPDTAESFLMGREFDDNFRNHVTQRYDTSSQRIEFVEARKIEGLRAESGDKEGFFYMHASSEKIWKEMYDQIPLVQSQLDSGKTVEQIMQDKELYNCAHAFFDINNSDLIQVAETPFGYKLSQEVRHRLLEAQRRGMKIPVRIVEKMI